jgi:hypothetical protein
VEESFGLREIHQRSNCLSDSCRLAKIKRVYHKPTLSGLLSHICARLTWGLEMLGENRSRVLSSPLLRIHFSFVPSKSTKFYIKINYQILVFSRLPACFHCYNGVYQATNFRQASHHLTSFSNPFTPLYFTFSTHVQHLSQLRVSIISQALAILTNTCFHPE